MGIVVPEKIYHLLFSVYTGGLSLSDKEDIRGFRFSLTDKISLFFRTGYIQMKKA